MSKIQFRRSAIVLAVSMAAAGGAFAAAGNTLEGPAITSGAATVNINQVGIGNVVSSNGEVGGGAVVVDTGTGALNLTIQQVGVAATSGANTLALAAYTANAATKIRVFQGGDVTGPGGTTGNGVSGSIDIGVDGVSTGNTATITLGSSGTKSDASEILVSQQGNANVAALTLGSAEFQGVMQVVQKGSSNTANVTVSGQTTSKTFNIGQSGDANTLRLTAVDMGGDVTANFGGIDFGALTTTSNPTATDTVGGNNAATYARTTANGVAGSTLAGINLGSTAGFNLMAIGNTNKVQVDLATADINSKVSVQLLGEGSNTLALYGAGGLINMGGTNGVTVEGGGLTLAAYADTGSTVAVNDVTFNGNGYFSATGGSSISVTGGTVTAGGMSILQTGGAHQATITGTGGSGTWAITQSDAGIKTATLVNTGSLANWTVAQSGAGAMTLEMTNATPSGVINVSQSGATSNSATGISFAAASGSTFTLAQK
ncbi:hypothetical protein [Polaromonas sp.]|uniref:hypothetical protein n=1 Tax=Polaromonas sp. TaxID=1869339 RepID=UPI0013BB65FD|nr:hypothetical protein [Polaromonas sp.]NDP64170.1 hypothetical protein [Polaromonas sp.]